MKKNRQAAQQQSNANTRSQRSDEDRSKTILLIALIFFLLGLFLWARATGFDLFKSLGLPDDFGTMGSNANSRTGSTGTNGVNGVSGQGGTSANGSGGSNGTNGGNGAGGTTSNGTGVNVNSDAGANVKAGVDANGKLYVQPSIGPTTQGGTGSKATVNDDKIIDTHDILK